jgi:hypothetical protein
VSLVPVTGLALFCCARLEARSSCVAFFFLQVVLPQCCLPGGSV